MPSWAPSCTGCAAAPTRAVTACFSTARRTDCDAGATWAPAAIARRLHATGPRAGRSRFTSSVSVPRTPERGSEAIDRPEASPDLTLERGFVASLRWLVSEGDARGVRRIAVELRALREALTTLDETRAARDEHARRA